MTHAEPCYFYRSVVLSDILSTIDPAQLAVAAAATLGYACTSVILQRAYVKRRRQRTQRSARFVARLIDGVRTGAVTTLSEATGVYHACCEGSTGDARTRQHLDFLIRRAFFRELRHTVCRGRAAVDETATDRETGVVLRRLLHQSQVAMMEELFERSGVSADDREWIRLEATRSAEQGHDSFLPDVQIRLRRVSQRRTASLVRNGLVGVGCIAFVEVVLVVWQSLR